MNNKIKLIIKLLCAILIFSTYKPCYASEADNEVFKSKGIWVGDSRTLSMELQIGECTYIDKGGAFYSWFKSDALPTLREMLDEDNDRIVIINFGVNDCANYAVNRKTNNADKYVEDINELIIDYPNTQFYYLSVNPVDGYFRTKYRESGKVFPDEVNREIELFNETIKDDCNATYIDSNTYLYENGFSTYDGIHYTASTNKKIFNFVVNSIIENQVGCKDEP